MFDADPFEGITIVSNGHLTPMSVINRCKYKTPPGARLERIEMVSSNRVRMSYRHHGVRTLNPLEFDL